MLDGRISIIIPVFNSERSLERCLNSVKVQTFKNIEVIIVNDGSTDGSEAICKRFAEEDSRFKYFYQENAGVSAARNLGLNECRTEFYTFIDSDDWVEAEYCQKMYAKAIEEHSDMVFCGINFIRDGIKYPKDEAIAIEDIIKNRHVEHFLTEVNESAMGSVWRVLYRSNNLGRLRFFEPLHIYEDLIFLLECIKYARKLSFVQDCLYNYDVPQVNYMKKYYTPQIIDACYMIGLKLQTILAYFGREDWAKAELFKQYINATTWVYIISKNNKQLQRAFKKHSSINEFNNKENYFHFKRLYNANKFKIFLIHKKHFFIYRLLYIIKNIF